MNRKKQSAQAQFTVHKAHIDNALARLQQLSDEHFNTHPDDIHWGHVANLAHYAELLKQLTDTAFHEGECAE